MAQDVGMVCSWADSNTLLLIYQTCIRPHLEYMYACQLWDPFLNKGMQSLEAVQKFACKVCLKRWDLDYDSILQLLNLPRLLVRREYLKLTTMYNIVIVVICTFHLVSLYKVTYHNTLIAQVHLTLLDHLHILITCITRLCLL